MAEENKPLPTLGLQFPVPTEGGKTSWPELVGATVEEAQEKIKIDMPRAAFQIVPPDHFVTMDFRTDRVRLYIDASGKIARAPQIG